MFDFQKLLIKKNHQNGKYKPRAAICSFILLKTNEDLPKSFTIHGLYIYIYIKK